MASLLTITDNLKPWLRRINLQNLRKTRNLTFLIKLFSGLNSKLYSGASRAARGAAHGRCPIGKKMWQSTHPRKFGNHVTVHRPTDRPTDRPPDLECDRRCLLFFGCTIRLSIRCKTFHSKLTSPFPQKSHECALKLTDLWITSLWFDLNYTWNFENLVSKNINSFYDLAI